MLRRMTGDRKSAIEGGGHDLQSIPEIKSVSFPSEIQTCNINDTPSFQSD